MRRIVTKASQNRPQSFSLLLVLVLSLVLLVSVIASSATTYMNIERFSESQEHTSVDAYIRARAALLPPPKVDGGGGASVVRLTDPMPGNAHTTRSPGAWTFAIRDSGNRRKVFVADDAATVLRSVGEGGGAWEALPVSSDADAYPATISAIRTIVADAFREGEEYRKGRPQLARALVEGLWRPKPAESREDELWRVLACFAGQDDDGSGRCFYMDVLLRQQTQLQGLPGRLLFATDIGKLDGGVLSQPQTML